MAGETLHSLAKRHDVSRNLIRIWVKKLEDARAVDLLQEYDAKIAARLSPISTAPPTPQSISWRSVVASQAPFHDRRGKHKPHASSPTAKRFLLHLKLGYAVPGRAYFRCVRGTAEMGQQQTSNPWVRCNGLQAY
jgi:hypothetical protein